MQARTDEHLPAPKSHSNNYAISSYEEQVKLIKRQEDAKHGVYRCMNSWNNHLYIVLNQNLDG